MATSLQDRLAQLTPEQRSQLALKLAKRGAALGKAQESSLPQVVADPAQRFAPFPMTDVQQAYWIGRSGAFELGEVAAHAYLELEGPFDVQRLERALDRMIARHDMLRGVILASGQQQVLPEAPPYRIEVADLRGADAEAVESRLAAVRHRMSHQVLPSDRYPLFHIHASLLDAGRVRLNVSLDALIFDGWSIALFFREWSRLYHDSDARLPDLDLTFRDYVLAELRVEQTETFARDRNYWLGRLEEMPPPPDLPLAKPPTELESGRFHRRTGRLEQVVWSRLKGRAARAGLTVTGILLAAYAEVVALWSQSPRFIINVPRFNRLPLHPQVNEIIGEAASFSLIAVDVSGSEGFETRAKRLQQQLWDDLDHSLFGGVRVLRELSKRRGSGALSPVVFTSAPQDKDGRDAYATLVARDLGELVTAINQTSQVWLDNHISEQDGALICDWDTVEELFPPGMAQDMFEAYMQFLARLADDEGAWAMSWAQLASHIVPPAQRERTRALNAKTAPIPNVLLQDLFAAQVPLRGDAAAVIDSRRTLSYRELDQLSHQWARRLRDAGIEPGRNVAVVMDKGWEQIVAVMAVLRAGCAYVPIDSRQPAERQRYMLENSDAACAFVQSWVNGDRSWPAGFRRFEVDNEDTAGKDSTPLPPTRQPEDAAYVIYTSGSTGEPKGVMVAHRSVVNVIVCTNQAFGIGHTDRAFAVTVLHHDLSVYDVFGLLATGGTIVLPDQAGRRDPEHWAELIQRHGVTIWNTVPAIMVMLLDYADSHPGAVPQTLRQVILGGDWVPVDLPRRLATHNPRTKLLCIGGPTETTIWNIWYRAENVQPDWKSIPYGQPIPNNSYHILDEAMVPRPDWVPGEQYCGGVGLALGYWGDPDKTADKFVHHPLTGERLYRTGDLGRWLPDGNIEFTGRADFQVKINGQRIELGEIEAAMRRHPAIRAAVVAMTERAGVGKRLAAYYVPQPGAMLEAEELRAFLATVLPEAMIPSFYLALERLPLTANGKVDRKSLPDPQPISPEVPAARAEAEDSVRGNVAQLVAGVLKLQTVDPEANLLALGANSIDMVRIGNELEKAFGFRPRMDQIFRLQTARAIAEYCEAQTGRKSPVQAVAVTRVEEDLCAIVASFGNLIEPEERDAFKESEPGIRRDDESRPFVQLEPPVVDEALLTSYCVRKSHRTFSLKPIPLEQFGRMLGCLYQISIDDKPKYLWPSPGGLYPVQVYLHVKAGRVTSLRAGTYYYHPVKHRLVGLTLDMEIDRSIHVPFVNTPVFDEAAFSIFLVSQLAAIAPSYGEASINFARIEAGIIAVLLEDAARECGLGLCQIGGVDFDRIRPLFNLDRSHLFVHSLLGGLPGGDAQVSVSLGTGAASARAAQLLARVRELTPKEAKTMLEAMNNEGKA